MTAADGRSRIDSWRWPIGLDEIRATFGDERRFLVRDDPTRVSDAWPAGMLHPVPLPEPLKLSFGGGFARRIACHEMVAPAIGAILAGLHDAGLWHDLEPYGGCYCFRPKSGNSGALSTHSWAVAFDFRVATCQRGTPGDMPPAIVEVFEQAGATWGGRWAGRQCDPMHFQFCGGY